MALPTEETAFTYGWSPNDFVQNFLAEGSDDRGGSDKGANESSLSILEGDVVQIGANFRGIKAYAFADTSVPVIGVALSDAKSGEMVPIACGPIVKCECGEAVTRGNQIGVDNGEAALIKPITLTGGGTEYGYLGIALHDGDDGDIIPVLMKSPGIAHTG